MKLKSRAGKGKAGKVTLGRALSKLGILSRAQALDAIRAGRVRVDGRVLTNPAALVVPERIRVTVDGETRERAPWRTILLNKPRGVVTTRRDPAGRRTVFDLVGDSERGLVAVGRLDLASSGLLLLTSDTRLADWITDPANGVSRLYVVTARGRVDASDLEQLRSGVTREATRIRAQAIDLRKASARESHLMVELREGKNREIRRLFEAIGREVTRLKRVKLGGLELGAVAPGHWREVSAQEVATAFPGAPIAGSSASRAFGVQGRRSL